MAYRTIEEADKALERYDPNKYLVLVRGEDLVTSSKFLRASIQMVTLDPRLLEAGGDFHLVDGAFVPWKGALDRIGVAAGIEFDRDGCSGHTETIEDEDGRRTIWVGKAVGRKMQPDGSMSSGSDEYEFDPYLSVLGRKNPPADKDVRTEVRKVQKHARAIASTGARLRTIKQLIGLPSAFSQRQISMPIVVSRIEQVYEEMLKDPALRSMIVPHIAGRTKSLFGPAATGPAVQPDEPDESDELHPDGDVTTPAGRPPSPPQERDEICEALSAELQQGGLKDATTDRIRELIEDQEVSAERLHSALKQVQQHRRANGVRPRG